MEVLRVVELEASTVTFLEEDVVHTHFKAQHLVQPSEVQAMFEVIGQERKGRKALLLVSMGEGTSMTADARVHASSEASCRYIAADAVVVRDFSHQLAANVFVRHNKPHRPIQLFPDRDQAISWLLTQHHLIEQP